MITLDISDNIATITLNKPETGNAFDDNLIKLFTNHLKYIQNNLNIKILILKSSGKHFSTGADLQWMQRAIKFSEEENRLDAKLLSDLLENLNNLPIPTICLLHGAVYGGALGVVACCDIAIADPYTKFCFSEVKLGLAPAIISPYIYAIAGIRACRKYMLTAEIFTAQTAEKINLITDIVVKTDQELHLKKLINQLLSNKKNALTATKQLIYTAENSRSFSELKNYTIDLIATLRISEEAQNSISEFLNKK